MFMYYLNNLTINFNKKKSIYKEERLMHYMEEEDVMLHRNERKVPPSGKKSIYTIEKNLSKPYIF